MKYADCITFGIASWLAAGGVVMGTLATVDRHAQVIAHSEQGDFKVEAPTASQASTLASEAVLAGATVEWINSTTFRTKFQSALWQWWEWFRINRLTGCVVTAGAEGRTYSLGVEG